MRTRTLEAGGCSQPAPTAVRAQLIFARRANFVLAGASRRPWSRRRGAKETDRGTDGQHRATHAHRRETMNALVLVASLGPRPAACRILGSLLKESWVPVLGASVLATLDPRRAAAPLRGRRALARLARARARARARLERRDLLHCSIIERDELIHASIISLWRAGLDRAGAGRC